ncbi:RNA polymerase sigma factor [Dawidia soli]|uniref:Sigma-70 family RNA polymerase sigma factor n=1 Tax=Dawidia soli TaxID=2782352 RepID=A0AAP2DF69_9BACT|nr:sigma-70 family RNA polymerase sigma factor [Dawidia soli]MBT1690152.1 sigma-70 family RNA polymerase sigma factor [Dawidia soli]
MITMESVLCLPDTTTDEVFFEEMYRQAFPVVAGFVSRTQGTFQDAKDIFHDALVIYLEKRAAGTLQLARTPEAYVVGIAKHLWLRAVRHDRHALSLDAFEAGLSIAEHAADVPDGKRLLRFLEVTGKKCMDLLRAWYYDGLHGKRLAETLGYANEHTAAVQKYKCLEKVRNVVKQKSMDYDDFLHGHTAN